MRLKKISAAIVFFISLVAFANAQEDTTLPFWKEVKAFQQADSASMPPQGAILFVGSSSFTKWADVQEYFPSHTIINRGFGGSSLPDLIRYADRIIFPYHPRQVVIYCGENDLAASDTVTSNMVFRRFRQLFQMIRSHMPGVPVAFVSIKPSPSRRQLWPKVTEANFMIRKYLESKTATAYIDVYHKMLRKDRRDVIADIFVDDSLHMNAGGYAIWQKVIEPYLLKK